MTLDIVAYNRSVSDFAILGGALEARLLKFSNRFTACSFYPIELKRGRMVPESALSLGVGLFDFPQGRCGGPLEIFKPTHSLQFLSDFSTIFASIHNLSVHNRCLASVAQRQSVGLGIERSRVRNSLVPSGFSLRQGN